MRDHPCAKVFQKGDYNAGSAVFQIRSFRGLSRPLFLPFRGALAYRRGKSLDNAIIVVGLMGGAAEGAVLYTVRVPAGGADAFRQEIERAITEKVVECFRIRVRVARKVSAGRVPEKAGAVLHGCFLKNSISVFRVTALTECRASYMHK